MTKDATIREIHHRVKNNLQTVAALLRLQARRLPEGEGRTALEEAVRRVGVIALVHDTLSHGFDERVDFDEIASRGLNAVVEVARAEHHVQAHIVGEFGMLRAEDATALAMILSELIQNAAEHGLSESGGSVEVAVKRSGEDGHELLEVTITDDGGPAGGLPARSVGAGQPDRPVARAGPARADHLGRSEAARNAGAVHGAASAVEQGLGVAPVCWFRCGGVAVPALVSRRGGRGRCAA